MIVSLSLSIIIIIVNLSITIAQACHASTAVLHLFGTDKNTQEYFSALDSMHKVVLQAPDLESLNQVAEKLRSNGLDFKLWIEQPENIPTCIAIKPYTKSELKDYVGHLKLYT